MKFDQVELDKLDITVIDGDRGKNYPHKDELLNTGYCLFLSANNVTKNGFEFSNNVYITKEKDAALHNGRLSRNDIVITTRGTVGNVGIYDETIKYEHMRINSGMLIVRCGQNIDNRFLYNVLRSKDFASQIDSIRTGSAQPQLPKSHFLKMVVPSIPLHFQRRIANILGMIDDKIALNQQINKNLEEQAQAIYKQMLCGNDCTVVELQELCTFQEGYVNPPQGNAEYFDGEVKWLRAVDINESYIINTSRTLTKEGFDSAKKSALLFEPDTIAISKSGTIGRLGIVGDYMCGNRAVINIKPKQREMLPFLYSFLKAKQKEFPDLAVGSVQKNLYVSLLEPLIVMMPPKDALQSFSKIANEQLELIKTNCLENEYLKQLRDALLPRLMSGEIDVSGIETDSFDYTEWRRNLFDNMTDDEYLKEAGEYAKTHPFKGRAKII